MVGTKRFRCPGSQTRSNIGNRNIRANSLPRLNWTTSKTVNGKIKYTYHSNMGDMASLTVSNDQNEGETFASLNNSIDNVKCSKKTGTINANHAFFENEFVGKVSKNGNTFIFSR
jgi:hypothetical protein